MIAVLLGVYNFANQMGQAVLVLLATQTLHLGTRGYGFLLAATAVGSVFGGLVAPRLTRKLGMLPSLITGAAINAAVFVGIGLAPDPAVAAVMLAGQGFTVTMWNVVTVTLRQQIVPARLLGRVNSVYRMLGWGLMPAALAGGFVAHAAGLRVPYVLAGIICALSLLAAFPVLLSASRCPLPSRGGTALRCCRRGRAPGVGVTGVTGVDCTAVGEVMVAGAVVVTVADGLGEGDTIAVGDALAVGDTVTVGDALGVAVTGADVLGVAVTGTDVRGEAEGAGAEVVEDVVGCPVAVPEECPEPLVSAIPV